MDGAIFPFESLRLKISVLEVLMTPARRIHELGKLSLLAKAVEKRIGYEISIRKKSGINAAAQHAESGRIVT